MEKAIERMRQLEKEWFDLVSDIESNKIELKGMSDHQKQAIISTIKFNATCLSLAAHLLHIDQKAAS